MIVIKVIFILFLVIYALAKIADGLDNKYINNTDRIINLVEIVVSTILTFIIFKI